MKYFTILILSLLSLTVFAHELNGKYEEGITNNWVNFKNYDIDTRPKVKSDSNYNALIKIDNFINVIDSSSQNDLNEYNKVFRLKLYNSKSEEERLYYKILLKLIAREK